MFVEGVFIQNRNCVLFRMEDLDGGHIVGDKIDIGSWKRKGTTS